MSTPSWSFSDRSSGPADRAIPRGTSCRALRLERPGQGQAMVEYILMALVITAVFFLPWDGRAGSESIVGLVLDALRTAHARYLGALSLPV